MSSPTFCRAMSFRIPFDDFTPNSRKICTKRNRGFRLSRLLSRGSFRSIVAWKAVMWQNINFQFRVIFRASERALSIYYTRHLCFWKQRNHSGGHKNGQKSIWGRGRRRRKSGQAQLMAVTRSQIGVFSFGLPQSPAPCDSRVQKNWL